MTAEIETAPDASLRVADSSALVEVFSLWHKVCTAWVFALFVSVLLVMLGKGLSNGPRSGEPFVQAAVTWAWIIAGTIPFVLTVISSVTLFHRLTPAQVRGFCAFPWNEAAQRYVQTLGSVRSPRIGHVLRTHRLHEHHLKDMARKHAAELSRIASEQARDEFRRFTQMAR